LVIDKVREEAAQRRAPVRKRAASRVKPAALQRPLLEIADVRKVFGKRVVLDQLTFSASLGELVAVTGDSGAGKSTLLRLIHGQLRPDRGRVWVDGHPLHRRFLRGIERLRRDSGFIFQDHRLLARLNAPENVIVALQMARPDVPYGVIRRAAHEALEAVGLAEDKRKFPVELSLGERQRVAVARTLALRPRLVLARHPAKERWDAFWLAGGRVVDWGPLPPQAEEIERRTRAAMSTRAARPGAGAVVPAAEVERTDRQWLDGAAVSHPIPRELEETAENEGLAAWMA